MNNIQITKRHYNQYNQLYLSTYGTIIQSYISENPSEMLAYMAAKMDLKDGDNILDAGSGFGGPALYFSRLFDIKILGINTDYDQIMVANTLAKKTNNKNVKFKLHDFHELYSLSKDNAFDKIYFLESIGHCNNLEALLKECYKVLTREGTVCIKTFFEGQNLKTEQPNQMKELIDFYGYTTFNYNDFKKTAEKCGFYIQEDNKFPNMNLDYKKVENFERPIRNKGLLKEGIGYGLKNFDMRLVILKRKFEFGKNI